MSRYTREQIDRANALDLRTYMESRGYELVPRGNYFCLKNDESLQVRGNQWRWTARQRRGKTLDFLMDYENMGFPAAMRALTGEVPERPAPAKSTGPYELKLPAPAEDNRAVWEYLTGRGIDGRVVWDCVDRGILYQTDMFWARNDAGEFIKEACPPQCVFVGKDREGVPRYAGTLSCEGPGEYETFGSDKAFPFAVPENSGAVWVYENPVDLLSHATLCGYAGNRHPAHRISLGGTSPEPLFRYLEEHPGIRYVNLALNADERGREAAKEAEEMLKDSYKVYDHAPVYGNDYNEDLLYRQARYRENHLRQERPGEER